MATKLKNLHIRKVDFVDEGANQRADIKIAKKKDADPETDIPVRESTMKRFMRAIGKVVALPMTALMLWRMCRKETRRHLVKR